MKLYHVTKAENRQSILTDGFRESNAPGIRGLGVWFSCAIFHPHDGFVPLEQADHYSEEFVIFCIDVPDDVAANYQDGDSVNLPPDDPEYDPEIDDGVILYGTGHWVIPPEVVNQFAVTVYTPKELAITAKVRSAAATLHEKRLLLADLRALRQTPTTGMAPSRTETLPRRVNDHGR
jgi:hypothetical protein